MGYDILSALKFLVDSQREYMFWIILIFTMLDISSFVFYIHMIPRDSKNKHYSHQYF